MKTFYKPDEMDSDDEEMEEITDANGDILIGFADEGDEEENDHMAQASDTGSEINEEYSDSDYVAESEEVEDDSSPSRLPIAEAAGAYHTGRNARSFPGFDNARPSTSADTDEEEDVIAKILERTKTPRTHPPDINIDDYVVDLSFHPEEDIMAAATVSGDALIYKYSVDGNELVSTLELHVKAIRDIEFSHDGSTLFSASKDRSILLTDVQTGKFTRSYDQAHEQPIYTMYIIDENMFATGDDDGRIKLWDIRDKSTAPIFSIKEGDDYITAIITNDAKRTLVTTSADGYLSAINMRQRRRLLVQSEPYDEELTCMGLFRNDSKLVVGTSKGRLYTFNWDEFGYHNNMYPGPKTPISRMIPVTDRVTVVAGEEGILRALHCIPGKTLGVVGQHKLAVDAMDINHSGEYIASSADDNEIKFWNIKYFEELDDFKCNEKHNKSKDSRHNLPSSKVANAGDFFSDLV